MKRLKAYISAFIIATSVFSQTIINEKFGTANVTFSNNKLTVSTGKVERTWKVTASGLVTTGIKNIETAKEWVNAPSVKCDWNYEGLISDTSSCKLLTLTAGKANDEGFTSEYIDVVAEFEYPTNHTFVKYNIWVYPDAPGIRTQVWIKGKATNSMLESRPKENKQAIQIKLNKGTKEKNYKASEIGTDWQASWASSAKEIEYQVFGLKKNKKYQLGFSWWDFEGKRRIQKIKLSSVDGETSVEVMRPTILPDFANKKEMSKEFLIDVPDNISLDGSLRIIIESTNNTSATVGEIWMNEKSGNIQSNVSLQGDENRLKRLKETTKELYSLVAYADCGNEPDEKAMSVYGRCDFLPIDVTSSKRIYSGYYNDTQHRNTRETPLLKEEIKDNLIKDSETVNWASLVMLEKEKEGLAIVKESHKCVNQYGVETGDFSITNMGVENRGTSLYPADLSPDEYKWFWAGWTVLWSGDADSGRLAIKKFDRVRYPVNPDLDIYIMANTWGSSRGKLAAKEQNVLKEIESQANLGIDIQQIDDGWEDENWLPSTEWYPTGWNNVVEKAMKNDIKLALWGAAMPITLEALKANYDNGKFVTYKLDFADLSTHDKIDKTINKIRNFVLYTNHKVRVNWDVTENAPRYGYFWAREYGSVFLENRKPDVPTNVVYVPYLVLRDLWHLAKYANLNKFQGTVQNNKMVDKKLSDAWKYSYSYCTAIPLMSSPLFFQETQFLSKEAVSEIKPIISAYKKVRNEMFDSYVYPVGNEPNNETWAGFQTIKPGSKLGFITLFREINNKETVKLIQMKFAASKNLTFTDLLSNKSFVEKSDSNGFVKFNINESADFRFYKYCIE